MAEDNPGLWYSLLMVDEQVKKCHLEIEQLFTAVRVILMSELHTVLLGQSEHCFFRCFSSSRDLFCSLFLFL